MFEILIVLGVGLFSAACRTFENSVVRKLGGIGILATSFLIAYYLTGRISLGVVAVLAWFLLPWVEILTRIRRLRLPLDKQLEKKMPPSNHRFPALRDVTEEIENLGFEYVGDTGWDWEVEEINQFFRIFYNAARREEVAVCLSEQGPVAFSYISISSRTPDGKTWRTWNYPFSYTLKLAPELVMNRSVSARCFTDLMHEHQAFLKRNQVEEGTVSAEDPEEIPGQMEIEIRRQIDHNLDNGLIALSGEGTFRYSWRGLFFLWVQFLKDMIKLS